MCNEIGHRKNLASVCADIGLEPRSRFLIPDLNDVGKSDGTVLVHEKLEARRLVVDLGVKGFFDLRDEGFDGKSGF